MSWTNATETAFWPFKMINILYSTWGKNKMETTNLSMIKAKMLASFEKSCIQTCSLMIPSQLFNLQCSRSCYSGVYSKCRDPFHYCPVCERHYSQAVPVHRWVHHDYIMCTCFLATQNEQAKGEQCWTAYFTLKWNNLSCGAERHFNWSPERSFKESFSQDKWNATRKRSHFPQSVIVLIQRRPVFEGVEHSMWVRLED